MFSNFYDINSVESIDSIKKLINLDLDGGLPPKKYELEGLCVTPLTKMNIARG
jgi:hypothetical protein